MPHTLRTMLCETRDAVHLLRKDLYCRGHVDGMLEIDTLLGFTEDQAMQAIRKIDQATKPG